MDWLNFIIYGMLLNEINYKDDKRDGICKEYYKDGTYKHIDIYKNDKLIKRKAYDERGKLEFEENYPAED